MKAYIILVFSLAIITSCSRELKKELTSNTQPLFELKENCGVDFQNNLTYTEDFNPYTYRNFYNGGGIAIGDVNNDGLLDLYFIGNIVDNRLYLNKGDWQFDDITEKAGVGCPNIWSSGATFVDINHDGFIDIYVCKSGKPEGSNRHNELFINNGDLTFTEQSKEYGLDITGLSVQAAFFDYDKDGDLDCYLLNNSIRSVGVYDLIKDQRNIPSDTGNKFLKNEGGKFIDFSSEAGIYTSNIGFGLGITLSDFNEDSWPDLFISNDFFERDYLYINNQKGGFEETAEIAISSFSMGSMGADAADLDNDLKPDLMVTEMLPTNIERQRTKALYESWDKYSLGVRQGYAHQFPRNVLQRNMGENGFLEIGRFSGVYATEWSWASLIFDMDNDGLRDIFISNGIYKDLLDRDYLTYMANEEKVRNMMKTQDEVIMKLIDLMPSKAIPNIAYKNNGGFVFEDKTADFGLDTPSFSNGSAYGDLDNDGDLDLVVNNVNMPSFIYENKTDTLTHRSLFLKFSSASKNTKGIGAKASIYFGNGQKAMAENYPSRGFESSVSDGLHFGLGEANSVDSLLIVWPNGAYTKEKNLVSNQTYTFREPSEPSASTIKNNLQTPKVSFSDTTPLFHFRHKENTFVDFNRERLLPYMSNNEGPALATGDINADGIMDVYVGGAKNQSGSLFMSHNKGYKEVTLPFEADAKSEDTDALFFDSDNDGDLDLYVCSGGKAFSKYDSFLNDRLYLNEQGTFSKTKKALPFPQPLSSTVVTATDYDKDGDMDLFVGGRFDPELYGTPVSSYVLINKGDNNFELADKKELIDLGMVTDATWSDINADGWPDLVVLGEWMSIKVFINHEGTLTDQTTRYGLDHTKGLWSSLSVLDLDNDGDMDIVGGNVGKNTFYKPGVRMYIKDFDGNGFAEQIICHKIDGKYYPIVDRDELISQLPGLKNKFLYFKDYATASIEDIFTKEELKGATILDIDMVETTVFININGKFSQHHLPSEVQYSNISAIEILDANRDGIKDLILGGNQYLVKPQFGRQDASQGWLVLGQLDQAKNYSTKNVKSLGIKGQIRNFVLLPQKDKTILLTAINNDEIQFREIQ
ncbi:MAG: VCBS repeat-containing protein [Maribacter sp.]|uniref:VCBS repeat-containing protein n=1 Tax=Maribacter sp. TaxID=1897614 RepID=UPI003C782FA9